MVLNATRVPEEIRSLLPIATRWDIGDDFDREAAVGSASVAELRELVAALAGKEGDVLYDWLAGPESRAAKPSREYLALTHMTMAADSARVKLKRDENAGT
jgi:hypothetical protein